MFKYKLLLINPVFSPMGPGRDRATKMPPLSLAYLASCTPEYYEIKIVDEYVTPWEYEKADIVGITAYSSHVLRAYEIARRYRQSGIPVIMGGIHASMCPDEALNHCRAVVIGEAENVWHQVLIDFENNDLKRKYQGPPADIKTLPFPRRDLLANAPYTWGSIITSRGCPMNCSFCSVTRFNGAKFRRRPVDAVVNELKQIKNKIIFFLDDNLFGHGDTGWLFEFFTKILKRKIKKYFFAQTSIQFGENTKLIRLAAKAGLRLVFVGMESVNYDSLKAYNKNLNAQIVKANRHVELINNIRKGGIAFMGGFMLGGDHDQIADFKTTIEYLKAARVDVLQLTKPTPLPGTRFFNELNNANRIIHSNYPEDWKNYRFTRMVYEPRHMTINDVYHGFHWVKKEFYRLPVQLLRNLRTLLDTKSLSAFIISFVMNRSYEKYFRSSDIYKKIESNKDDYIEFKQKLNM